MLRPSLELAHGFLFKFYMGTREGKFAYNSVSHREYNFDINFEYKRRVLLKPKDLALLFVSAEPIPPLMLKTKWDAWFLST